MSPSFEKQQLGTQDKYENEKQKLVEQSMESIKQRASVFRTTDALEMAIASGLYPGGEEVKQFFAKRLADGTIGESDGVLEYYTHDEVVTLPSSEQNYQLLLNIGLKYDPNQGALITPARFREANIHSLDRATLDKLEQGIEREVRARENEKIERKQEQEQEEKQVGNLKDEITGMFDS